MINETQNNVTIPLCVDLDGTLIRTDSLVETAALFLKQYFLMAVLFPIWLLSGRARFKEEIASRIKLDVAYLPYEDKVIDVIRQARGDGREVILCTGANQRYAEAVADYLGLFDGVIASDANTNLTSGEKRRVLTQRYGKGGYDYIGNDRKDLPAFVMPESLSWYLRHSYCAGRKVRWLMWRCW